jgi:uncharacterized protein
MPQGKIIWVDLTVPNADEVRDFYQQVAGWTPFNVEMGDYNDYSMLDAPGGAPVAGVCHKQGVNASLPSHWLIYISVDDLASSIAACEQLGGKVITQPRDVGDGTLFAVIQDNGGAYAGLMQLPKTPSP